MRKKYYIWSVIAIVVLRFLDLYITYLYTPDLKSEWNPLVSIFGVTWLGFVFTQILIVSFVSSLMFFYFNRTPTEIVQKGLSFNDFIYVYFFGKLRPWPSRMFSIPTNIKRHLVFDGFLLMLITILISVFAIANNLLLIFQADFYVVFMEKHYSTFFPVSIIIITIFSVYLFFGIEYRKYKKSQNLIY
jgi:hypothetical protein